MKAFGAEPSVRSKRSEVEIRIVNTRRFFTSLLILTIIFVGILMILLNAETNDPLPVRKIRKVHLDKISELMKDYSNRLSKLPSSRNKDVSRSFIDFGPPVEKLPNNKPGNSSGRTKLVQLWTTYNGQVDWIPNIVTCAKKETSCHVTTNKKDLLKSDAVVFHAFDIQSFSLPQKRLANQRWVYIANHPPYLVRNQTGSDTLKYNGVFNWTSSYKRDSDFPVAFEKSALLKKPLTSNLFRATLENVTRKKRKLLAVVFMECDNKQSAQFNILTEIRRYISADVYGDCGLATCPWHDSQCRQKLSSYKFHLVFEDRNCEFKEHIILSLNKWMSVPIVFGGHPQDFSKIIPPNSYIHAEGFDSIRKLAEYLTLLDKHPALYNKYHLWRKTYSVHERHVTPFPDLCQLCEALFDQTLPVKVYRDFRGWLEKDSCWPL